MRHIWIVLGLALGLAWGLWMVKPSRGHEHDPHWVQYTPDERNWMGEALTTQRSRPRLASKGFVWHSCCNQGDRVKTQFRVSKESGQDEWWFLKKGDTEQTDEWVRIPNDIIHTEEDFDDDAKMKNKMSPQMRTEGVLFIYQGTPTCFWAPQEGG